MIKKLITYSSVLFSMSTLGAYASQVPQIQQTQDTYLIDSGEGYSVYEVSGTDYQTYVSSLQRQMSSAALNVSSQETPDMPSFEDYQVASQKVSTQAYVFDSLVGVMNSDLPYSHKLDILSDYDVTPSDALDQVEIGLLIVDKNQADYQLGNGLALKSAALQNGEVTPLGLCKKKWHDRTKAGSFSLASLTDSYKRGDLNFNVNSGISGNISYELSYKYKTNRCSFNVPYKHSITGFKAKGSLHSNGGSISINGTVIDTTQDMLFDESLLNGGIDKELDFWVGPVRIVWSHEFDLRARLAGGIRIDAQMGLNFDVNGKYQFDFKCDMVGQNNCYNASETVNTFEAKLKNPTLTGGVSVRARVQPEIAAVYTQRAGIYLKGLSPVRLTLDTFLYGYAELWAYYGNACGDGNYDGVNEVIGGAAIDAGVGVAGKFSWRVFSNRKEEPLRIKLLDGWVEKELDGRGEYMAIQKSLYFDELVESDAFLPVVDAPDVILSGDNKVKVAMRSCFPYASQMTYQVKFGDGSVKEVKGSPSGVFVNHTFNDYVSYPITVTALKDSENRRFRAISSTREVIASPDGVTTFNPVYFVTVL
ncbi:hypothetical protein N480_00615 [Pseudoalteromonas luteoviolacea S2607]|uniref:hypothetical protein n=1 Tax=Pseudoalteromonas luteoviolacea TaxID=43657 RepID=UPI0007B05A47|nr:hypothetical protein [Pseudoalteromonas luteoviolacea]KZN39364.1 hypothetical protein N480_00615 [Pseudoalteromonas luteoviolacea S2607]